jgi:hypothetical protein
MLRCELQCFVLYEDGVDGHAGALAATVAVCLLQGVLLESARVNLGMLRYHDAKSARRTHNTTIPSCSRDTSTTVSLITRCVAMETRLWLAHIPAV